MTKKRFNKNYIYDELIKIAGEMWNLKPNQLNNIDPVVKMLFKGLASEVEKVGDELMNAETRILKRIARQLLPREEVSVQPAHGIIHFTPTERIEISKFEQFLYETKWINKDKFNREELRQIIFSSVGSFKILPGKLNYRLEENRVIQTDGLSRDLLETQSHINNDRQIVLGFNKISGSRLSLYFDWISSSSKSELFSALSKLRVTTLSGKTLTTSSGITNLDEVSDPFKNNLNQTLRLEKSVLSFYEDQFLEVDLANLKESDLKMNEETPDEIADTINDIDDGHEQDWLIVNFPEEFSSQNVQDAFIQTNCIPVVNRSMQREIFRLQPGLNIRRLKIEGSFMNMERVVTTDDVKYVEDSSIKLDDYSEGTYAVRQGGIGRLDERDADEFLSYMLDLITEEKQAFSSLGVSSTLEDLKVIDQAIKRVQKRIHNTGEKGLSPYILLNPRRQYENVYAYYWVCSGELANGIKLGSHLTCQTPALTVSGSAVLLTNTLGGRDNLSDAEIIEKYRHALLTKDSIVTNEDIISLCGTIAGKHLSHVNIETKIVPSAVFKEGLIKVLNINLHLKSSGKEEIVKNYILKKVKSELDSKSNFSIPYNISAVNG